MRVLTNNDDIKKYIIKVIKDFFNDNKKNDPIPKRNKTTKTLSYKFDERNVYTIIYI